MASEKPDKKEKKDKKSKRSETDGITKASKKDKKDKKAKKKLEKLAEVRDLDEKLQAAAAATVEAKNTTGAEDSDSEVEETIKVTVAVDTVKASLVPFAKPLVQDKQEKKVLKCVRKSAKAKTIKRGVKEVVKALRKSPDAGPNTTSFPGVVIIAGDISPIDVISHIPVLCEDHNVPYVFVTSRAELGAAGSTKRPTSVVMVCEKSNRKSKDNKEESKDEEVEDFPEAYKELVKLVQKETLKQVRV